MDTTVPHQSSDQLDASIVTIKADLSQQQSGAMVEVAASVDLLKWSGGFVGGSRHGGGLFTGVADFARRRSVSRQA